MSNVFTLLLAREARLLFRRPAELANPLVFFAIVIALFPLAVGPESEMLKNLSPGLVWVAALLAVLLSLDGLFRSDSRMVPWSSGSFRRTPCHYWSWPKCWHTGWFQGWPWCCCRRCSP